MKATTRVRSTALIRLLLRMTTKYAAAATIVTSTTAVDRLSAVRMPVTAASTTTATTTTPAMTNAARRFAGNGLGTSLASAGRFLRPKA